MTDWHKVQRDVRKNVLGRLLLGALSWVYGAGMLARGLCYGLGLFKSRRLPLRTVCFGNLTAGGTGKTSAVLLAAEELAKHKLKPAVLSRGYGRSKASRDVVVMGGGREADWSEAGDEPWMMRQALKDRDVPVLVCPDRYKAGLVAAEELGASVALLDDGFQHLALKRDTDIVLLNASDPFGGGLLPLGLSREPKRALRRASLILLTHTDRVDKEALEALREQVDALAPGIPVAESVHAAKDLLDPRSGVRHPLETLKDREVVTLCALGDPAGFEDLLKRQGARLTQCWRYPDHHRYTVDEMRSIETLRQGRALVTTMKDMPRLAPGWMDDLTGDVWVLAATLKITKGKDHWRKALLGEDA